MLDVFGEDYIRTARSKGMTERRVVLRHNLRASLTPVLTQFGLDVGALIGGAIVTETGVQPGRYRLQGGESRAEPGPAADPGHRHRRVDGHRRLPTCIVDIFYAVLDPRVRLH